MRHPTTLLALTVVLACDPTAVQPPENTHKPTTPAPHEACADDHAAKPAQPTTASPPTRPTLVLHEWGTFTAVSGADGNAIAWRPLTGPSDLPAFVHSQTRPGAPHTVRGKGSITGTVRMETPVIYFYADHPLDVSLSVQFTGGVLTEWYPQAARWTGDTLDWGKFAVLPANPHDLARIPEPTTRGHYFAARDTDAAVVRVPSPDRDEHEKFLFYRGVGSFDLSLAVRLDGDSLTLTTRAPAGVPALVFERRNGRIGFNKGHVGANGLTLARPDLDDDLPAVISRLEALLLAEGLYPRESAAMIATWQGHWFEDGLRVFYLVPKDEVEALLPLTVEPAPTERVRTIIGRIEVVTPELEAAVRTELTRPGAAPLARCRALQNNHGRFAEPVARRIAVTTPSPTDRTAAAQVLEQIDRGTCVTAD